MAAKFGPSDGPFSQALLPAAYEATTKPSGYGGVTEAALSIGSKFLEGMSRGRIQKYAMQEAKKGEAFNAVVASAQNMLADPDLDPEVKRGVQQKLMNIYAQSTMGQLKESGGHKEGFGGMLKGLLEGMTGGELKGKDLKPDELLNFLGEIHAVGSDPKNRITGKLSGANDVLLGAIQKAQEQKGSRLYRQEVEELPEFNQWKLIHDKLDPQRSEARTKEIVNRFDVRPAPGSTEAKALELEEQRKASLASAAAQGGSTPAPPASAAQNSTLFMAPSNTKPTGLLEAGNIDLRAQPAIPNPEEPGKMSTVDSMSIEVDGKEILIPRVTPDGRFLSEDGAKEEYRKTGRHLGVFSSPDEATAYANQLHNDYESGKLSQQPGGQFFGRTARAASGGRGETQAPPVPRAAAQATLTPAQIEYATNSKQLDKPRAAYRADGTSFFVTNISGGGGIPPGDYVTENGTYRMVTEPYFPAPPPKGEVHEASDGKLYSIAANGTSKAVTLPSGKPFQARNLAPGFFSNDQGFWTVNRATSVAEPVKDENGKRIPPPSKSASPNIIARQFANAVASTKKNTLRITEGLDAEKARRDRQIDLDSSPRQGQYPGMVTPPRLTPEAAIAARQALATEIAQRKQQTLDYEKDLIEGLRIGHGQPVAAAAAAGATAAPPQAPLPLLKPEQITDLE